MYSQCAVQQLLNPKHGCAISYFFPSRAAYCTHSYLLLESTNVDETSCCSNCSRGSTTYFLAIKTRRCSDAHSKRVQVIAYLLLMMLHWIRSPLIVSFLSHSAVVIGCFKSFTSFDEFYQAILYLSLTMNTHTSS